MTFSTYEESVRLGSPIELFELTIGSTVYRYTSHTVAYTTGDGTYEPIIIRRSNISDTTDLAKADLTLRVNRDSGFVTFISSYLPSTVILLVIKRVHENDPDQQVIVTWKGRIIDFTWQGHEVEVKAESVLTSINRLGVTRTFSENCNFNLFSTECRLQRGNFITNATIVSRTGRTMVVSTVDGNPDQYYLGGYAEINLSNGLLERRLIVSQISTTLILNYAFSTNLGTSNIVLLPGCDKTVATCLNKYNNLNNYGGFPFTPSVNPFSTTLY